MLTALVPRTDWSAAFAASHPAFAPLGPVAARFAAFSDWPPVHAWNALLADLPLRSASGMPLRFVTQPPRRRRGARVALSDVYDVRIYERAEVPSRERSWHDFFNMLCWAILPRAKASLNARQHRSLRASIEDGAPRMPGARTRERDALAWFHRTHAIDSDEITDAADRADAT